MTTFDGINMSSSQEIQEIHSSIKRVVCVWDRVLRSTRSPSPQCHMTSDGMHHTTRLWEAVSKINVDDDLEFEDER